MGSKQAQQTSPPPWTSPPPRARPPPPCDHVIYPMMHLVSPPPDLDRVSDTYPPTPLNTHSPPPGHQLPCPGHHLPSTPGYHLSSPDSTSPWTLPSSQTPHTPTPPPGHHLPPGQHFPPPPPDITSLPQVRIQDLVKGGPASKAESCQHSGAKLCKQSKLSAARVQGLLKGPLKL